MNTRNLVTLTILLGITAGSWYLARSLETEEVTQTVSGSRLSGFYLRSARILGADDDGRWLYEIEAEYAEQQPNNDIEMSNVRIRYASSAGVPWTIDADAATIRDSASLVSLRGHVIAVSNEGFAGQVTEIRTPYLEIDPNTYQAATHERVQIRIGSRSLTATGMLALLRENRLTLQSNVSGKFVP